MTDSPSKPSAVLESLLKQSKRDLGIALIKSKRREKTFEQKCGAAVSLYKDQHKVRSRSERRSYRTRQKGGISFRTFRFRSDSSFIHFRQVFVDFLSIVLGESQRNELSGKVLKLEDLRNRYRKVAEASSVQAKERDKALRASYEHLKTDYATMREDKDKKIVELVAKLRGMLTKYKALQERLQERSSQSGSNSFKVQTTLEETNARLLNELEGARATEQRLEETEAARRMTFEGRMRRVEAEHAKEIASTKSEHAEQTAIAIEARLASYVGQHEGSSKLVDRMRSLQLELKELKFLRDRARDEVSNLSGRLKTSEEEAALCRFVESKSRKELSELRSMHRSDRERLEKMTLQLEDREKARIPNTNETAIVVNSNRAAPIEILDASVDDRIDSLRQRERALEEILERERKDRHEAKRRYEGDREEFVERLSSIEKQRDAALDQRERLLESAGSRERDDSDRRERIERMTVECRLSTEQRTIAERSLEMLRATTSAFEARESEELALVRNRLNEVTSTPSDELSELREQWKRETETREAEQRARIAEMRDREHVAEIALRREIESQETVAKALDEKCVQEQKRYAALRQKAGRQLVTLEKQKKAAVARLRECTEVAQASKDRIKALETSHRQTVSEETDSWREKVDDLRKRLQRENRIATERSSEIATQEDGRNRSNAEQRKIDLDNKMLRGTVTDLQRALKVAERALREERRKDMKVNSFKEERDVHVRALAAIRRDAEADINVARKAFEAELEAARIRANGSVEILQSRIDEIRDAEHCEEQSARRQEKRSSVLSAELNDLEVVSQRRSAELVDELKRARDREHAMELQLAAVCVPIKGKDSRVDGRSAETNKRSISQMMVSLRTELTEERLHASALRRRLQRSESECRSRSDRFREMEAEYKSSKMAIELGKAQIVDLSKKVAQLSGGKGWLSGW